MSIEKLAAEIKTELSREQYARQHVQAFLTALAIDNIAQDGAEGPYLEHPGHEKALATFGEQIDRIRQNPEAVDTIAFGDSILDFARGHLESIPADANFGLAASWPHNVTRMALQIIPALAGIAGFAPRYLVIGTPGGNPLLLKQAPGGVLAQTLFCLDSVRDEARKYWPGIQFILYGLPPTYSPTVYQARPEYTATLIRWADRDGNACYVDICSGFGGLFGLFPSLRMSSDGIHQTPRGILKMDQRFKQAKSGFFRVVI